MERNRGQLYYREGSSFQRLPESEGGDLPMADIIEMRKAKEAKLAIEGISDFKERHIAFGDTQIPDLDRKALEVVLKINQDWKATHMWLMGDMINATTVSKYGYPPTYDRDLQSEIDEGREMIAFIAEEARKANPDVKIKYLEGNHELRLKKFMERQARELVVLREKDGKPTVALDRMLGLEENGVEWIPYWDDAHIKKATVLHGNIVRQKAGYTAHAYIDKYGDTSMAGHTHRLAMIARTQNGVEKFGIETGSLCKREMKLPYTRPGQTDWQQGLATIGIDKKNVLYPAIIPIINGRAGFGDKLYDSRG